ncbi:tumor suppressor 2, mitochondrial calcium regulator a isoform X1 [Silurus meridionalis]|uniref:tumor suppressor 2, mitochondrial calcium regulator a isoform X1 n=1 Tax=Silurus meridionalis TaxID=175797 RepID=UPI001EEBB1FB|nr:tumor suppressor 2, mitochondrial calcium regulator a isoform X1 [Silurus meridionalis]
MGGSGSKAKGVWPFTGSGSSGECPDVSDQSLARMCGYKNATPFVFTRRRLLRRNVLCACSSLYFDEDGDLAHEFYEETVVTKNGRKKAKLKRIHKNLVPQGIVKLDHPRIHVDFPVIICEI